MFLHCDHDLWPFSPKSMPYVYWLSHVIPYTKYEHFGIIRFWVIVRKNKQTNRRITHRQTRMIALLMRLPSAWVITLYTTCTTTSSLTATITISLHAFLDMRKLKCDFWSFAFISTFAPESRALVHHRPLISILTRQIYRQLVSSSVYGTKINKPSININIRLIEHVKTHAYIYEK